MGYSMTTPEPQRTLNTLSLFTRWQAMGRERRPTLRQWLGRELQAALEQRLRERDARYHMLERMWRGADLPRREPCMCGRCFEKLRRGEPGDWYTAGTAVPE